MNNLGLKAKLFTCGIYGNYPFEYLLTHAEKLERHTIFGQKFLNPFETRKILKFKPNVIIIYGLESFAGIFLYFFAKIARIRVMGIIEENNTTKFLELKKRFFQSIKRFLVKFIYKSCDILIAESEASKSYVEEILSVNRKIPILVKVHGVNIDLFSKYRYLAKEEAKNLILNLVQLHIPVTKKWFLFLGPPSFYKGIDVLLDTIKLLSNTQILDNCVFLLPATVEYDLLYDCKKIAPKYYKLLSEFIDKNFVTLYLPLAHETTLIFYRATDFVVLPSRYLLILVVTDLQMWL